MSTRSISRALSQPTSILQATPSCKSAASAQRAGLVGQCQSPQVQCQQQRHQSTYRRHNARMAMTESPVARTTRVSGPSSSHIIFNPPPTLPNVLHTPLKFLPPNDPRRKFYQSERIPSLYNIPTTSGNSPEGRLNSMSKLDDVTQGTRVMTTPGTALREVPFSHPAGFSGRLSPGGALPPPVRPLETWSPSKILTQEEVEEIRSLRKQDPWTNTVNTLARRYSCSPELVKGIQEGSLEVKIAHAKALEKVQATWGRRKTKARRERVRRKEFWLRDA